VFIEFKTRELERLRADVTEMRAHLDMMNAVCALSMTPLWAKYIEGANHLMESKVDKLLTMDGENLPYLDRKQAELRAEVRLLKQIIVAPDRFSHESVELRENIEKAEARISELEKLVSRVKGVM